MSNLGRCDFRQYEHCGPHEQIPSIGQRLPPFGCKNWKVDTSGPCRECGDTHYHLRSCSFDREWKGPAPVLDSERAVPVMEAGCTWTLTPNPYCEFWEPSCGGDPWQFETGGPTKNKMKFCCFCAQPLTEFVEPMENDDGD